MLSQPGDLNGIGETSSRGPGVVTVINRLDLVRSAFELATDLLQLNQQVGVMMVMIQEVALLRLQECQ